jgi:hypothetical protein
MNQCPRGSIQQLGRLISHDLAASARQGVVTVSTYLGVNLNPVRHATKSSPGIAESGGNALVPERPVRRRKQIDTTSYGYHPAITT